MYTTQVQTNKHTAHTFSDFRGSLLLIKLVKLTNYKDILHLNKNKSVYLLDSLRSVLLEVKDDQVFDNERR